MNSAARFLRILSLILWLGGIVFFAAVVAPAVFGVLTPVEGGRHLAGDIVNRSLSTLHWMGMVCGVVFLACSTMISKKFMTLQNMLVAAMLALTAFSQFSISERMHAIRLRAGEVDRLLAEDARRLEFNRLHRLSTVTEGAILLLGLGVSGVLARRPE